MVRVHRSRRRRRLFAVACVASAAFAACKFAPNAGTGDAGGVDAPPDTPVVVVCSDAPSTTCVDANTLATCTVVGTNATITTCGFGCDATSTARCRHLLPSGSGADPADLDPASLQALDAVVLEDVTISGNNGEITNGTQTGSAVYADRTRVAVFRARSFELKGTIRLTGSRPIVLIADGPIKVTGTVLAKGCTDGFKVVPGPGGFGGGSSSGQAGSSFDGSASGGGSTANGGDGGGGGGNGGLGGSGGHGDATGGLAQGDAAISILFGGGGGGCGEGGGGRGRGGGGGGAIQLASNTSIEVVGAIDAGGCGGDGGDGGGDHGGGGGAGGTILLEAPVVTVNGVLAANGGGGGGGGGGNNGSAGDLTTTPAVGGGGANNDDGDGGTGGAGDTNEGKRGGDPPSSATRGGGGGGVGRIRLNTRDAIAPTVGGVITPTFGSANATAGSAAVQ